MVKMAEGNCTVFFIMGVSGSGKTTVGQLLAQELGFNFFDGDDYHPRSNVVKMSRGVPLDDNDRLPWLQTINKLAVKEGQAGCVIACSALKAKYRKILTKGLPHHVHWIFLDGDYQIISERLKRRIGHFMPEELLRSQFETLEIPTEAIRISVGSAPSEQLAEIIRQWNLKRKSG